MASIAPRVDLKGIFKRPEELLVATFLGTIIFGTALLMLPASQSSKSLSLLDALFTATSAVCVTGLTVADTARDFTPTGQFYIMLLMQIGGFGIMTYAVLIGLLSGFKFGFQSQAALCGVIYGKDSAEQLRRALRYVIMITFVIESIGAFLLYAALPAELPFLERAGNAIFHAVSAFCNAGFSLYSNNLSEIKNNVPFLMVIVLLVISGGIGYSVIMEGAGRIHCWFRGTVSKVKSSLTTRVVVRFTALLILFGTAALLLAGSGDQSLSTTETVLSAFFHSVSARTAGFNLIDISSLPITSLMIFMVLMFIGGSPGSCAGGVKTTSFAIWLATVGAFLQQREDVTLLGRRIPIELIRRTGFLFSIALAFNLFGFFVLALTEGVSPSKPLQYLMFEQLSAFGTVGLSCGITPNLSNQGKLWIILSMFVGRLGPISFGLFLVEQRRAAYRLPQEELMIG